MAEKACHAFASTTQVGLTQALALIPNMARKPKKAQRPDRSQSAFPTVPWYKRAWVLISGTAVVVAAVLLNAPQMLQNARILPKEVGETTAQFRSWLNEDSEWTGNWSAHPEAYADLADMRLSDVDMQITIWASQGEIDGTIATREICKSIPVLNYVLLRGEVFGNTAHVIAWDIVQGHKQDFAELRLVRDDNVITVTPTNGMKDWFPSIARLARSSPEPKSEPEPDQSFCDPERKAFFNKRRLSPPDEG